MTYAKLNCLKYSCLRIQWCIIKSQINWIVYDKEQFFVPFNFVDLCKIEFFEIKLFDYLIEWKTND